MSNDTAKTSTINIVPVQGIFTETAELVTLIGPAGTPFYANIDPNQTGLHITNSTIDSSTIGATTPSTGVFTDIQTTTGSIATAPSADTDIVNKAYVDAIAQGLDIKASCLTASIANITTLSGLLTIDGVLLVAGDRVLVKNQSTQANNGIYVASATAWARSADMNTWAEVPSAFTFVESGSTQANSGWVCTSQAGGTLGVTAITFVQFSGAGTYSAGTGLTLTGSQFSITNTGVVAATKGSASKTVTGAVNAQGQLTSFTDQDIAIAGTQITSGTIDTARLSGSYTGITGVGTLTDLTVTNTIVGSITGNAATATTAGSAGSATTATTATNLAGGLIGNVPYQTSAGATTFLATGSNTQVLTLAGGVPTWATPTTGTVTSVSGTGTVNGLTLTGTVTSTGSLTLGGTLDLSAPPAIGGTTAAAITGTTITANTKFLSTYFDADTSAGGNLRNLSGAACFQWGAGGGTNSTVNGSINMNGLNAHIDMSPTGTGHVTINPTALGDMNNMAIGATTASTAKVTTLDISSTLALAGSTGSSGQVITSQGASAPIWAAPTASIAITDDTTTNAVRYPLFTSATTGSISTEYVASTKYNFNPSTGTLSATVFSGSGASLTSIPNSALTNSSVTIGSTAVALGATVTTFAGLTSVTSTTFVGALTGNADTATSATSATNATNTAITDDTTNASAVYPTWVTTTTGNLPQKTSSTKLSFIPNTGILTATGFAGPLSGNATTATTLETARNIAGVSFNGSADITIALDNLSDVVIATPTVDQIIKYNGTDWVNGAASSISAGFGVEYYNATPQITASGTNSALAIFTLSATPITTAEQTTTTTTINGTVAGTAWLSTALGRTTLDAGTWDFTVFASVSSIGGVQTTVKRQMYAALPFVTGTVTTTGTGTSRTATASAGTPFATTEIDASATNTLASYLQTPQGLYQITARTSDTVVTISTLTTYVNEAAVAGTVWKLLFAGGASPNLTTSITQYDIISVQPAFTISVLTKLGAITFATSTGVRTVTTTYNGTLRNTHIASPLAVLHNQLGGLQGGAANEQYHLTDAEYTGSGTGVFARATSPTLVTPALGTPSALVGTNITGTATAFTASNVTTNANLTGPITSVGNATSIASQTGTGTTFAMSASPTFTGTVGAADFTTTGNTILGNASADTLNVGNGDLIKDTSGNTLVGTANAIGKLGVATASATGAPGAWSNGFFTVAPGGATNSGGVGLSYDTTGNTGAITALSPGVAWRKLKYFALNHDWIVSNGATTGMTLDASSNLAITGALSFGSFLGGIGKSGTFLRNSGTATGTVAYTGIGFKPSAIIFLATITGLPSESVGFTDATAGYSLWIDNTYGTGGGGYANAIYFLRLQAGNGNYQLADISTMDADGFTLSWTRTVVGTGTPTTNISVYYMAFR